MAAKVVFSGIRSTMLYVRCLVLIVFFTSILPLYAGVNPDGSFSETIPIEIPPGRNGIQPQLALTYNSNAGNGMVGVGFSLQGLMAITRMNYGRGINYDGQDTYTGPEGRLIFVQNGVWPEYVSENATWSKFEALGWDFSPVHIGNRCGGQGALVAEPCIWRVTDRNGMIYLYGATDDSRIIARDQGGNPLHNGAARAWALTKVIDLNGNAYEVEYYQNAGQYYPKAVRYTLGAGVSESFAVTFAYDESARADRFTAYTQGAHVQTNWLLSEIAVIQRSSCLIFFTCSESIRRYGLSFETVMPQRQSRLINLRQIDAHGISLPPMNFAWSQSQNGLQPAGNWLPPAALQYRIGDVRDSNGTLLIDINGDGLPDQLMHVWDGNSHTGAWLNTGDSWVYAGQWVPPAALGYRIGKVIDNNGTQIIDINGDGLPDLLTHLWDGSSHQGAWLNTGNGWAYAPQWIPPAALGYRIGTVIDSNGTRFADVNGDGRPDLLMHVWDGSSHMGAWINNGNGWTYAPEWTPPAALGYRIGKVVDANGTRIIDLNGDGLPDLVMHVWENASYQGAWLNNGHGWVYAPQWLPPAALGYRIGTVVDTNGAEFADVNGDGLPDLLWHIWENASYTGAWLNSGNGWVYAPQWSPPAALGYRIGTVLDDNGTRIVDMNGDGRLDLVMHLWDGASHMGAWLNTDNGWVSAPEWTPPAALGYRIGQRTDSNGTAFADVNGDGQIDLLMHVWEHASYQGAWLNKNPSPMLLTRITSGNGVDTIIAYTQKGKYPKAVCEATNNFPCSYLPIGMLQPDHTNRNLVLSVRTTNNMNLAGANSASPETLELSYEYFNARFQNGSVTDRTFLGFERIIVKNHSNGHSTSTTYRQDKPFHGTPVLTRSYLANGTLVSEQQSAPLAQYLCTGAVCAHDSANTPHPTQPRQIRQAGPSVSRAYEAGILKLTKTEEVLAYDNYGNALRTRTRQESGGNLTEVYIFRQYINNFTTTRAIGLSFYEKSCLSEVECTEGDGSFVAATRFYYDNQPLGQVGTRHLVTRKEVYGPTDSGGGWVAETFAYNLHGLIEDHRAANGTRTETAYDGQYRSYPANVVTTSGSQNILSTTLYDYRFGKPRYTWDSQSGIYVELFYDALGRVTEKVSRHSGQIKAKVTSQYSAYGVQPAWQKDCTYFGAAFTETKCATKYADAFGRIYREEFPEFVNGQQAQMATERQFDARGREAKSSKPFSAAHSGCAGAANAGANPATCEWNTSQYDDYNRVVSITDFNNKTTSVEYPTSGLPFSAVAGSVTTSSDGRKKGEFKNIHGKIAASYDALHDLNRVSTVRYSYDALGRLVTVVAPAGTTTITYVGSTSLQKSIFDPVAGLTEYEYYATPGQSSYGKLKTEKRGGYITAFEYNATFGRLTKTTKAAISTPLALLESISYVYDETDKPNSKGRLTTLRHEKDGFIITERYSYDVLGEVTETVRTVSHTALTLCQNADAIPCTQVFGKTKDNSGRVTEMLYPDGTKTQVEYVDTLSSFVKSIRHDGTLYAEYDDYTYDVAPHLGRVRYHNGLAHEYTYHADTGLLKNAKVSTSSATLLDYEYAYDTSYNIQRIEDKVIAKLNLYYQYDGHNRIKSALRGDGSARNYRFDNPHTINTAGKLELKHNRLLHYPADKTYPTSDEVLDPATNTWQANQTFGWSATGNLLTKGPFTFEYDANNMMVKSTEAPLPASPASGGGAEGGGGAETRFFYDHTGQRFLKTHTRNGVMIKTWYLGDGIEFREKYVGPSTSSGQGQFEAYQTTKYIYGIDDKKIASITGDVKTTQPTSTTENLFALADSYSAQSIAGVTMKVYYTHYGVYAFIRQGFKSVPNGRILLLIFLSGILFVYLFRSTRSYGLKPIAAVSSWQRATAYVMLVSFITVNCGTGNAPGTTPTDLGGPSSPIGTPGDDETGAAPTNTFISALYTGLPAGTVYYSHNHLGSGALVTDSAGNEIFRITYTEYGEIDLHNSGKWNAATEEFERTVSDAEIAITAVKYTGQEYDPETGFYYYNARYFDPQLGVFTTPDTEFDANAGSFGFNRHMYVAGNPIMYSDPSGHLLWFSVDKNGLSFGISIGAASVGVDIGWKNGFSVGANASLGPRAGVNFFGVGNMTQANAGVSFGYNFGQQTGYGSLFATAGVQFGGWGMGASASLNWTYRDGYTGGSASAGFNVGFATFGGGIGWDKKGDFAGYSVGMGLMGSTDDYGGSLGISYGSDGFNVSLGGYADEDYLFSSNRGQPEPAAEVASIAPTPRKAARRRARVRDNDDQSTWPSCNVATYPCVEAGLHQAPLFPSEFTLGLGNFFKSAFSFGKFAMASGNGFKTLSDKYLKGKGIDAHALKKEYLGRKAPIAQFDIVRDTRTHELLLLRKGPSGSTIPTGRILK